LFDEKSKAMLMLVMLNEIYSDVASSHRNLRDFVSSHPEMSEEMQKYGLIELLSLAEKFEREVEEVMNRLKKVVYS